MFHDSHQQHINPEWLRTANLNLLRQPSKVKNLSETQNMLGTCREMQTYKGSVGKW